MNTKNLSRYMTDTCQKQEKTDVVSHCEAQTGKEIWILSDPSYKSGTLTVLLGKTRRLEEGDLAVRIQILLIPAQDDDDVGAGQRPCVRQPVSQSIVGLPTRRQIKTKSKSCSAFDDTHCQSSFTENHDINVNVESLNISMPYSRLEQSDNIV